MARVAGQLQSREATATGTGTAPRQLPKLINCRSQTFCTTTHHNENCNRYRSRHARFYCLIFQFDTLCRRIALLKIWTTFNRHPIVILSSLWLVCNEPDSKKLVSIQVTVQLRIPAWAMLSWRKAQNLTSPAKKRTHLFPEKENCRPDILEAMSCLCSSAFITCS